MKKLILVASLCLGAAVSAPAALISSTYTTGFENSGNITDGNVNPWSDTRTVSGNAETAIQSVSVRLNISGGYNGDLHVYLSYNGVNVPLLNRVGVGSGNAFGYGDAGLNVTFTDTAANNVHFYQSVNGYSIANGATWQPDGRTISPLSAPSAFDAGGTVTFAAFSGMNPNGDWSLVASDLSAGGGTSHIESWGLDITAVPEPTTLALVIFGGVAITVSGVRFWNRRRTRRQAATIIW